MKHFGLGCGVLLAAIFSVACDGASDPPASAPRSGTRPNLVLITLESLRPDHVGAYGGRSGTQPQEAITPNLDAFAKEAVVYERAHSVTSWTLSSHASLFTGLYPSAHQTRAPVSKLGDDYTTLAEILRDQGYSTGAVVSGPYLRAKHNLTQGFESLDDSSSSAIQLRAHSDVTNPKMELGLIDFVERKRDAEKPFFLFAYFWDPHYDFLPPAPYDTLFLNGDTESIDVHSFDTSKTIHAGTPRAQMDFVLAQYDGEIRATDESLGRFFALLRDRDLWDDSLIIITADHGEEFFDHGEKGHKNNLYDETVHVPLFVKYPRDAPSQPEAGGRDARLVSLIDVAPTVAEVFGFEPEAPWQGRSLLAEVDPARPIFFELLSNWYFQDALGTRVRQESWRAVKRENWKWVERAEDGKTPATQLFDIHKDRREERDLAASHAEEVEALRKLVEEQQQASRSLAAGFASGGSAELGAEEREQLCALGYLSGDACADLP